MNQDAFRNLIGSGQLASGGPSQSRGSFLPLKHNHGTKNKETQESKIKSTQFTPRKVKAGEGKYRDRAAERLAGINDYADVEALKNAFEKQNAEVEDKATVEEQRRMLGGDAHHTVLVKGLDFALLEQQRAKLAQGQAPADDDLESAFLEASISVPKKKSREELVMELKQARSSASAAHVAQDGLDRAKMAGKFKPIGAPDKPVEKEKTKKKKRAKDGADDGERKKKKRKIESEPAVEAPRKGEEDDKTPEQKISGEIPDGAAEATRPGLTKRKVPTPPPVNDEDDIFADAVEYKCLEISDEEEEERPEAQPKPHARHSPPASALSNKPILNWFEEPVEPNRPPVSLTPSSVAPAPVVSSASSSKPQGRREEDEDDLIEGAKLRGLASSAIPSIKDILAMDEAAEREEKRKARKEKKKAKKVSEDAKLNREVKKLDKYISEKGG